MTRTTLTSVSAVMIESEGSNDKLKEPLIKSINSRICLARGAGDSVKPGVERSGTPGGGPVLRIERAKRAIAETPQFPDDHRLSPASRALSCGAMQAWGSASLHPRLYAIARSAG